MTGNEQKKQGRVINHMFATVEVTRESGALRAKMSVDLRESSGEGNEIYFQPLRRTLFWSLPPKTSLFSEPTATDGGKSCPKEK